MSSSVKFADGSPYGTSQRAVSGTVLRAIDDDPRTAARHQAKGSRGSRGPASRFRAA